MVGTKLMFKLFIALSEHFFNVVKNFAWSKLLAFNSLAEGFESLAKEGIQVESL
jgi:hypothetical protein